MWVKNKRARVVVVLKMRVLGRKWEMTDYQNGSLIGDCTAGGRDKGKCTVQLGIVVHGGTNTNQNAVMHCPHPVLGSTDIVYRGNLSNMGGNCSPMSHPHTFFTAKNKLLFASTRNFRIDRLCKREGDIRTGAVRWDEIRKRFCSRLYICR